jgi:hypothetical protein
VEEGASETLDFGGRCSRRVCKPGQRTSRTARLASDTIGGPVDLEELINPGEEVLCGLELVHDGSIPSKRQRQGRRYTRLTNSERAKKMADALPLKRFWEPDGLVMLFCLVAAGCWPRGEILEPAKRVQVSGHDFARGLLQGDLFRSCSTGLEAGVSAAVGTLEMTDLLLGQIWRKPRTSVRGKPYTSVN